MNKKTLAAAAAAAAAIGVAGCLGSDGGSSSSTIAGTLLDAAVEGVAYSASPSGKSGSTSASGGFECATGDTVSFKIGGISFGSASCGATVTPLTLAGVSAWTGSDDKVNNRLLFVQSLDEDDEPGNGIKITGAVSSALAGASLDFSKANASFNTDLAAVLPNVNDKFGASYKARTPSAGRLAVAKEHFETTLGTALGQSETTKVTQTSAGGQVAISKYMLSADTSLYIPYGGSNAAAKADFPNGFFPAVGSGLAFKGKASDGSLEFYGITDRGPNGDSPNAPTPADTSKTSISKMFPAPAFVPSIGLISIGSGGARIKSLMPLKANATTSLSGLPPAAGSVGNSGEVPLTDGYVYDAAKVAFNANGLDPESLVYDAANKAFWTSDEYGPFIVKIDATSGVVLKKYQPGTGAADLPDVLKHRRANRGMEGLTMAASGKLHGFLQSPIEPLDSAGKSVEVTDSADLDQDGKNNDKVKVKDFAQFARWIEFDPATETSRLYAYPLNYALSSTGEKWDRNRTGSAKLGDVVALSNGKFIVIEQGADSKGAVRNFLMLVEIPANATNIRDDGIELEKNSIDGSTTTTHPWSGVVAMKKTLLLDLNAAGWLAEKAEGLTLVDGQTVALINDNDFGLRSVLTDASGAIVDGDITACTVNTNGGIVADGTCASGAVSGRVTRGSDTERQTRLWLFKFPQALTGFSIP